MKKVVFALTVIVLIFGWLAVGLSFGGTVKSFNDNITKAERSIEEGLYEQGVEYYNAALAIKADDELLKAIKDAYYQFYQEQKNNYSYNRYINALQKCCQTFETDGSLWEELVDAYYRGGSYSEAFEACNKAVKYGAATDVIQRIETEISHMYEVEFKSITGYKIGKNHTYSVTDGNNYWIMRYNGEVVGIEYKYVGPLDEKGKAIFIDNAGSNIRDTYQITRVLLKQPIEESGFFNSGMAPVRVNGVWLYLKEDGTDAEIGKFDYASSMCGGIAAVLRGEKWSVIDTTGQSAVSGTFEDVVLDKYGCCTDGEHLLAAQGGVYQCCDRAGNVLARLPDVVSVDVGDFSEPFAYQDKTTKLWGYMNTTGDVVIAPQYSCAKGFSNDYAAIQNEEGLWCVISTDGEPITGYEFYDIGYFTSEGNCLVARSEASYGLFSFRFR